MAIRKQKEGKWQCECYPNGREGKRIRKQFETRAEAIAYENAQIEEAKARPWSGDKEELSTKVLTGGNTVQQSEP